MDEATWVDKYMTADCVTPGDSTVLAILAHEGCEKTIDDFLPKWRSVPAVLIGCYPKGQRSHSGFKTVFHVGESARTGPVVYRRFTNTLRNLLNWQCGRIIMAEYDTVPLRPELPKMHEGKMTSSVCVDHDSFGTGQRQYACLSPWIFDREAANAFINAADATLSDNPDPIQCGGLLDRWIAHVCIAHSVPAHCFLDSCDFAPQRGIEEIRKRGWNWVHGWKSKKEFGELWND